MNVVVQVSLDTDVAYHEFHPPVLRGEIGITGKVQWMAPECDVSVEYVNNQVGSQLSIHYLPFEATFLSD